jgi:hypothetical protein
MEIKDQSFYQVLDTELEELGFIRFVNSFDLFPIWFHREKQIYIQAVSLSHFNSLKKDLSPKLWQESILANRKKYVHYLCIWEDIWILRSNFIKGHIYHLLHGNSSIFARDLKVGFVPEKLVSEFLTATHILGSSKGKTYLGIFVPPHRHFREIKSPYEFEGNPLVSVAVFGKTLVMKDEKFRGQKSVELVRFASLSGTRIMGGITKALSFYQKTFLVDNLMTYVDLEWNNGQGFLGIDFKVESITNPLLFKIDTANHRAMTPNWEEANACNAGNLKLRYELK